MKAILLILGFTLAMAPSLLRASSMGEAEAKINQIDDQDIQSQRVDEVAAIPIPGDLIPATPPEPAQKVDRQVASAKHRATKKHHGKKIAKHEKSKKHAALNKKKHKYAAKSIKLKKHKARHVASIGGLPTELPPKRIR